MFRPNPEVYQELPQDSPKAKTKRKITPNSVPWLESSLEIQNI